MRVAVKPHMLVWARERAGATADALERRFPKIAEWESGQVRPTLKQLEAFARAVRVPFGYLFLSEPPDEPLPIPDLRTLASRAVTRPSPELLDTIYACQQRQEWYREFARVHHQSELPFIASATLRSSPAEIAVQMGATIGFDLEAREKCRSWKEALRLFIGQAEGAGALVMVSGIVGSNTHRRLDVGEFRGFALSDRLAPVVFINGADSKSAQMFTLAHELAHLWLGASAISNMGLASCSSGFRREEVWCNKVAAELLVPRAALRKALTEMAQDERAGGLARRFKVSTLVILRRLLDVRHLTRETFETAWESELRQLRLIKERSSGGGAFHKTAPARVSRRFARALIVSTLEGHTLYRDAFRMLGISKTRTLNTIGREVGVLE